MCCNTNNTWVSGANTVTETLTQYRVSTRRSAELALLVGAWLIGVFAWILVDSATGQISFGGWTSQLRE